MGIRKFCTTLILLLFNVAFAHSQEVSLDVPFDLRTERDFANADTLENYIRINKRHQNIEVHFKFDKYNLELDYMGNRGSLEEFSHKVDSIGYSKIDSIVIISQSSPEGIYEHNLMLSRNRANTMRRHILDRHPNLSHLLYVHPDGESWERLREYVKMDTLMKKSTIEKIISIIDADINVGTKKWRMEQLPVYRYLLQTYYPKIRNSTFYILYYSEIIPRKVEPKPELELIVKKDTTYTTAIFEPIIPITEEWSRQLHLKTNAIGLGMAIANVAIEVDLAKHWSFSLPIYYSAWNYFRSPIKFRTLAVQPEFRYWFKPDNEGWFVGGHFGLAYYNIASNSDYRYQDHNRETPAIGGGIAAGYRTHISQDKRWKMEFTLGGGVYPLHYDKFHNTPNTTEGLMIEEVKKTYWGIDQIAVTFSYAFDLKKKGGKK